MQHLAALTRYRTTMFAGAAIALGAIIIAWTLARHLASPAQSDADLSPPDVPVAADGFELLSEPPPEPAEQPDPMSDDTVIVYVSGAVWAPDVYQLPAQARVKDLVLAAGGLTEDADAVRINLADRLTDGQHVHVPRQGEAAEGAADDAAGAPAGPGADGLVNINTASTSELEDLPGVGQVLAQRLIDHRTANGPFRSVEDLQNVKGIGPALYASIAPLVTVGP